jgi:transposase InsO family protein
VKELNSTTADLVIPCLHEIFSTFDIPKTIKSDNGASFKSADFQRFCSYFGVKHRLITPYWPRANGEVERFNKNLSKVMKYASVLGTSWHKELNFFLGAYRATPHSSTGVPPAQLIYKYSSTQRLAQVCLERTFDRTNADELALENDKAA